LKKIKIIALITMLCFLCTIPVFAAPNVTVKIDGAAVIFPDQKPYIDSNNRTLVPMRAPMEAMGATVDWNDDTRQAIFEKDGINAVFTIGSKTYTVNGVKKTMDTQAVITGDRTCIPIRFAAEAIGARVDWDHNTYTVLISTTGATNGTAKTVVLEKSNDTSSRDAIKVGDYNIDISNNYNDPTMWFGIIDASRPQKLIRVVCTSHPEWNSGVRPVWDGTYKEFPTDYWTNCYMFYHRGYTPDPKSGDVVTFDVYGKVNCYCHPIMSSNRRC
jgi:hypothetical protein